MPGFTMPKIIATWESTRKAARRIMGIPAVRYEKMAVASTHVRNSPFEVRGMTTVGTR